MKLTDENIASIKQLYGEDFDAADKVIDLLRKKKGVVKIFNKQGGIDYTVEEVEEKLNKPNKTRVATPDNEILDKISKHFTEIKNLIKQIKRTDKFNFVRNEITFVNMSITRRYNTLLEREIQLTDKEIKQLQEKREQLERDKIKRDKQD